MPGDNQSSIADTPSTDDDTAAPNFNKFDQLMMETRAVLLRYEDYKSTVTILKIVNLISSLHGILNGDQVCCASET